MSKPSDKQRADLKEFARQLDALPRMTSGRIGMSPISTRLADWVSGAINRYLTGGAKSLDAALGLKKPTGRPVTKATEHAAIAREAFDLLRKGRTWEEIAVAVSINREDAIDDRTLRGIVTAHLSELVAEEFSLEDGGASEQFWQEGDPDPPKPKLKQRPRT